MEQDKISCSILFLMFWGQIGVKFNFFEKWTISYNEKTPIKKHAASIKYRNYVLFLLSVIFQITASGCGSQIWTDDLRVMRFRKCCFLFFFKTKNKEKQRFFISFLWYIPLFLLFSVLVRVCIRVRNDEPFRIPITIFMARIIHHTTASITVFPFREMVFIPDFLFLLKLKLSR